MNNFKNRNGFTLVEVMTALLIVGIMMGSLFLSETLVVRSVSLFSRGLDRILAAKNLLYKIHKEKDKKEDKSAASRQEIIKEAGYTTQLTYENSPAKIGALKNFKDIAVERIAIEWREQSRRRTDELITFEFKPKKAKKKE